MNIKAFWNRTKNLIKEKCVTQAETAAACGISHSKFRNWMSQNKVPPINVANRLALFLGVSLEYLISGQGKDKFSLVNEEVIVLLKEAERKLTEIRRRTS